MKKPIKILLWCAAITIIITLTLAILVPIIEMIISIARL